MELWSGILVSDNAAKVRIALAEKGLAYTIREIPWSKAAQWGHKPSEFLAVSPRGQVPALVDEGFAIHDSTVIIEYLEEKYPLPALFPQTVKDRATCRIWEDEADYQQQYLGTLIRDLYLQSAGAPTAAATEAAAALGKFLQRLNDQLSGREFICAGFSVADISCFMIVGFAQAMGVPVTQPKVLSWFQRMMARATVRSEFEAMMATAATS